jgi:hypothetical protein
MRGRGAIRIVVVNGTVVSDPPGLDPSLPMVDVTTRPGERIELTLPNRSFAEPSATIRVQAVDALDRQPIALSDDEVFVTPCELAESIQGDSERRSGAAVAVRGEPGGALRYEVSAGAYVLSVNPRHHYSSRPWSDFIDVQPGDHEITVALPRAQGVVVEIVVPCAVVQWREEWFDRVLPKLQRRNETLQPEAFWPDPGPSTQRLVHRYAPLAAGKLELVVPDGVGYDRSGVIPLEVRENEVTTIELSLTPPTDPDSGR